MKDKTKTQNLVPAQHSLGNAAEFEVLLRSSMDELMIKSNKHQEAWGFGLEEQWFLDQGTGELIWTFPDSTTSAPAQVIGSWQTDAGTWTWAWDDPSIPDDLKSDALRVKEYGQQHGFQHLITPSWEAEESHCWYMAALACWLCDAKGVYRGVTDNTYTFLTFGDVRSAPSPEPTSETSVEDFLSQASDEFRLCDFNPEEQRQACCRYLKRGAAAGVAQAELIHQLGLATPSVLDRAGYSAEAAQNVMDLLKSISDDEIDECSA